MEALQLIYQNRGKGQTSRLVDMSVISGSLLVVGNQQHAYSLRSTKSNSGLQVCPVQNLESTLGLRSEGGVVFDNFALVHLFNAAISDMSDQNLELVRMGSETENLRSELAAAKAQIEDLTVRLSEASDKSPKSVDQTRPGATIPKTTKTRHQTPSSPVQLYLFESETKK